MDGPKHGHSIYMVGKNTWIGWISLLHQKRAVWHWIRHGFDCLGCQFPISNSHDTVGHRRVSSWQALCLDEAHWSEGWIWSYHRGGKWWFQEFKSLGFMASGSEALIDLGPFRPFYHQPFGSCTKIYIGIWCNFQRLTVEILIPTNSPPTSKIHHPLDLCAFSKPL